MDNAIANFDSSLNGLLAALRREQNASVKAVNLPDEVICEILSYGPISGIIQGSMVCHRWRHAALTQPRLWTSIELGTGRRDLNKILMQIERSGNCPLYVTFGGHHSSLPSQRTLWDILARAQTVTHFDSRFFQSAGVSESFAMPHLESMQYINDLSHDMQRLKCIRNSPRLQHLSLICNSVTGFQTLVFVRNLQTLHISTAKEHPDTILFVLSKLPMLREFCMSSATINHDQGGKDREAIVASNTFPKLHILSITQCSVEYVSQILIPPLILPHTNVHLEVNLPRFGSFELNYHRETMASTLWVYNNRSSYLLSHEISFTNFILPLRHNTEPLSHISTFIDCSSIASLSLPEDPFTSAEISIFPNLTRLEFVFPGFNIGVETSSLTNILNHDIPLSCPNLEFIGLVFQDSPRLSIDYPDGASAVIEYFLESWMEIHGRIFGTIRIQDEINPYRWEVYAPVLEIMLETFEIGVVAVSDGIPIFPRTWEFV
jgi:hypothetical protein